ncbi:MAG: hypothetical protein PHT69_00270 [Bacteroidales bacterium]|nr:hypothetical protein [Bacteroidales bacterium]
MNRKFYRIMQSPLLLLALLFILSISFSAFISTENTPAGYTGSPKDDKDCSSCHRARPKNEEGIILSNCSGNSYEPLRTYTLTIKLKGNESSRKFGFQITPQTPTGKLQGRLIVTDAEQTKLANAKYLNQTANGVDGNGEKTWSFDWQAPASGSGNVTFYGSFLIGGRPEIVLNSSLTLTEKR